MEKPFPAYKGDEPYVFICYSHEDADIVYPELRRLYEEGVNVWYDEGISAGQVWRAEIATAIRNASKFVLFISPRSLTSSHCMREIHFALDKETGVLPVYLETVALPDELDLALGRVQAIHKQADPSYKTRLMEVLSEIPDAPASPQKSSYSVSTLRPKYLRGLVWATLLVLTIVIGRWLTDDFGWPLSEEQMVGAGLGPSIAVLPFTNLSPLEDNAFFAAGVHEDVLTKLSRVPGLRVISRTSVMVYERSRAQLDEVSADLGVTHVLEGSVRRAGEKARITVQLIDAHRDEHLWSTTYDRKLADIFAVQSELADEITSQLQLSMSVPPEPRSVADMQAYDLYLRGRESLRDAAYQNLGEARRLFSEAIRIDPQFAQAHAMLSMTYSDVSAMPGLGMDAERAHLHAQEAMRLAPNSSHANLALAEALSQERRNTEARRYYEKALEFNPNDSEAMFAFGMSLMYDGNYGDAARQWQESLRVDPLSAATHVQIASVLGWQQRYEEMQEYIQRALTIDPSNAVLRLQAGWTLFNAGQALNALETVYEGLRNEPGNIALMNQLGWILLVLGHYEAAGDWADHMEQVRPHSADFLRASLLNVLRKPDEMLAFVQDWQRRAPKEHMVVHFLADAWSRQAERAAESGDRTSAIEFKRKAEILHDRYLAPYRVDGVVDIRTDNYFDLLSHAYTARLNGDYELASNEANAIIEFSIKEPLFSQTFGLFGQGAAFAVMGEDDKAMAAFLRIEKESPGFLWPFVFDGYGLREAHWGTSRELADALRENGLVDRLEARNAALRRQITKEMADILDPQTLNL